MLVMQCLNFFNSQLLNVIAIEKHEIGHNCFTIEATMTDLIEEQSLDTFEKATSC
jgi:hypothetical protein